MSLGTADLGILSRLEWRHLLLIVGVLVAARLLTAAAAWGFGRLADAVHGRWRLAVLFWQPLVRLGILLGAAALIVPLLIQPTVQNLLALLAAGGLALAFALKDYGTSLMAGLVIVFERPYQPGDWISLGGTYGEVQAIGLRAVRLLTPDDTLVVIPHSALWTTSLANATAGQRHVLCVTDFYLHPEHDGARVRAQLTDMAASSPYLKPESFVTVVAAEKPWGTHYRLKAYAKDSRDQFQFTTDLTIRGKAALLALGVKLAYVPVATSGS
jgi:small conductance mechanosensitive channel